MRGCDNAKLKFYLLPSGNLGFGVGASFRRRGAEAAADAIRTEIGEMASEGTLSAIFYRSFFDPSNESMIVYDLAEARQQNRYMGVGIGLLVVVLALLAWQSLRVRAARLAADAANVALEEQVSARTSELTEANDQLRQEIAERKRAEDSLRQAQKMEAIGRLAGGIAHDFNNLLSIISGYAYLLRESLSGNPALLEKVDAIAKAGDRASSMTRQLLAFSRRQVTQPKLLNLNDVLSDMARLLQRLLREDIELTISTHPDLRLIKADPGQIEQVIMNLVINARDAMPSGGKLALETENVTLNQDTYSGTDPSSYVRLTVRDTGSGMDADTKAHVFEPFFTTKEEGKGTGLGLATVYGLTKQAGGHIALDSELGRGTTFYVYLPAVEGGVSAEAHSATLSPARGWETILVVEDQEGLRTLVCEVLQKQGYRTITASDGREAVRLAQSHEHIDLILTDVVMPQMGGRELAKTLASSHPRIKILYMSGYVNKQISQEEMPGLEIIHKPFTPEVLARRVREVLDASCAIRD
jgi:signal transduction histidine kinase/CheY-like chemotaxis protein